MDLNLDEIDSPQVKAKQATLKEMARRSQDRIRVFNPLDEDYTIRFDGIGFVIPNRNKDNGHGLGTAVVFRYVAENYRTQMIDFILTTKLDEAIRLENERRAGLGMLPMTKFIGGEELTFCNSLRTDNEEARSNLIPIVWLGLAERYGVETRQETQSGKPKDDRPLDERLADRLEKQDSHTTTPKVSGALTPLGELQSKDTFTLRKIAREKGIATEKTDRKDALIAKISQ